MARKYHNKEWLERKYWQEGMDTQDIGRECGVVRETVRRWMEKHGIPRRSRGPEEGETQVRSEELRDESWLRNQYVAQEKSMDKIANQLGVAEQTVHNWLTRHGIESRSNGDVFTPRSSMADVRLDDEEWLRTEYEEKERSMGAIAQELGVTPPAIKYRLDEYDIERRGDGNALEAGDSVFQRDPEWQQKRERRLQMDGYECQDCGVEEDDYYRSLDVHHLTKKEEFVDENGNVDWESANAMDNMVSLCQSCHMKRHVK